MIKLKINNKQVEVATGTTILDAAAAVGVAIPTMCFLKSYAPSTSCMVCVVQVKGKASLIPACGAVDPGFEEGFGEPLAEYWNRTGHEIKIEHTDYGILAHSTQNRENPCFLCSRLRRKRLFEIADELGCNKIALGHNKDDIIETLFMNICYAGEISTMMPAQSFFQERFTLIRPLAFVDEDVIRRFAKEKSCPDFINPCPTAKVSKRQEIKRLLQQLYTSNKKVKGNIFRAMSHVKTDYLLK